MYIYYYTLLRNNELLRDQRSETDIFLLRDSVKAVTRNHIYLNMQSLDYTLTFYGLV